MTDLYRRASDRFERVIATATPSTLDGLDPLDRLQVQLAVCWSSSVLPVALGIGEECGELADAKTHAEATDAVGDVAIYVCQVATRERLAMSEILAEAGRIADRALATNRGLTHQWRTLMSRVGRVAHLALKRHQKIREGALPDAEYRALLADALAELLAAVELAAGVSVAECFADTAPTVLSAPPVLDALSISQPWAWLIVSRLKRVENRQWGAAQLAQARARVGRRFAVHAAKSYDADAAEDLADHGIVVPERPRLAAGAIVGVATLVRVITVAEALADVGLEDQRLYISGPVCLVLADVVAVDPIPARGFLGFWPLPDAVAEALAAQIAGPA